MDFVKKGGHLLLENEFADRFPLDFLGAKAIIDLKKVPLTEFGSTS